MNDVGKALPEIKDVQPFTPVPHPDYSPQHRSRPSLTAAGDIGHNSRQNPQDYLTRYFASDTGVKTPMRSFLPQQHSESFDYQPSLPQSNESSQERSIFRSGTRRLKRAYTLFRWGYQSEDGGEDPMLGKQDQQWPDESSSVDFEIEHNLYDYHQGPLTPDDRPLKDTELGVTGLDPAKEVAIDPYLVSYAADDKRHPYNWSDSRKYAILVVMCSAAVCVTVGSSIQASTYTQLVNEFKIPRTEAVAGVSLYVLGFGIGARQCNST